MRLAKLQKREKLNVLKRNGADVETCDGCQNLDWNNGKRWCKRMLAYPLTIDGNILRCVLCKGPRIGPKKETK
jgi:hypothetical protein